MTEKFGVTRQLNDLGSLYAKEVALEDDLDLATRALILASLTVLPATEAAILRFSHSRKLKLAGAVAPVVALGLGSLADSAMLMVQGYAKQTATDAIELATEHSLAVPEWAKIDDQDLTSAQQQ